MSVPHEWCVCETLVAAVVGAAAGAREQPNPQECKYSHDQEEHGQVGGIAAGRGCVLCQHTSGGQRQDEEQNECPSLKFHRDYSCVSIRHSSIVTQKVRSHREMT